MRRVVLARLSLRDGGAASGQTFETKSPIDGVIEIRIGAAVVRVEGAPNPGTLGVILQSLLR